MVIDIHLLVSVVIRLFCNEIEVSLVEIYNSIQEISTLGLKNEPCVKAMLRPCHPLQLKSAGRSPWCHPMSFLAGCIMPLGVQLYPHPRVGQQEDAASEPDSFLFYPLLRIPLLYKTMSPQSSLRKSLDFACISV